MSDDEYGAGVGDNFDYGGGGFGDDAYVRHFSYSLLAIPQANDPCFLLFVCFFRMRITISSHKKARAARGKMMCR
jgi:hypothetical protein